MVILVSWNTKDFATRISWWRNFWILSWHPTMLDPTIKPFLSLSTVSSYFWKKSLITLKGLNLAIICLFKLTLKFWVRQSSGQFSTFSAKRYMKKIIEIVQKLIMKCSGVGFNPFFLLIIMMVWMDIVFNTRFPLLILPNELGHWK